MNMPPQSRFDPVIAEEKLQGEHTPFGTNFKAVADNIKSWRLDALRDGLCCFTVAMYLHESIDVENALRAAASEKQTNTPEGWKLVPVEATNEMQWAANDYSTATESKPKGMWWWNRLYQAMLAAAPEAPK